MAIKKRTTTDLATEAKIEAFGAAADTAPSTSKTGETTPKTNAATGAVRPRLRTEDVAKTFLIRFPDATLPLLLAEVAQLDERSQHAVALRALRRGLEAMKADGPS